jgi:hypothetical protein
MPVYREVSKTDAPTPEAAVEFIRQDTGGQVQRAQGFDVIEESDRWRVPVFSTDGRASMPMLPHGAVFPGNNCLSATEIERQINQFGGGEEQGWTPGIATGPGFNKQ